MKWRPMLVALISAIDGLSLLYQRLQQYRQNFITVLSIYLAPDFSIQPTCVFPRLTPLPSHQWSLVIYSLPDCRIFPSSYCRIVVFYRIVVFPSSFHRPFSLRFIIGLSFFLSSYYWIVVFTRLSFFPSSYIRIVVLFTGLTLFPSSYYRFSLRLITN